VDTPLGCIFRRPAPDGRCQRRNSSKDVASFRCKPIGQHAPVGKSHHVDSIRVNLQVHAHIIDRSSNETHIIDIVIRRLAAAMAYVPMLKKPKIPMPLGYMIIKFSLAARSLKAEYFSMPAAVSNAP